MGSFEQCAATLTLLLVYGASMVPLMYLLSNGFESPASAQIGLIVINLICGFMLNLVHLVCEALESVQVTPW